MSVFSKTLLVVGVSAALAGAAYAASEPWVLRADMGYVIDKDGKTMVENLNTMDKAKMAKATAVPKGTVFFMQDGHMMMMSIDR
jgi:hypothetical protein